MPRHLRARIHVCDAQRPYTQWPGQLCMDVEIDLAEDGTATIVAPELIPAAAMDQVQRKLMRIQREHQAEQRAERLLTRMLTDVQRESFDRGRRIYLTGSLGGRYRIDCDGGYSGNVYQLTEKGKRRASFCAYPRFDRENWDSASMPRGDMWLGQLLLLRTDEARFLEVAVLQGRWDDNDERLW